MRSFYGADPSIKQHRLFLRRELELAKRAALQAHSPEIPSLLLMKFHGVSISATSATPSLGQIPSTSSARAIAMSCRWPCEKFVPPADTLVSRLTVVFASMSIVDVPAVNAASVVSVRSMFVMDGAREVARDELALARWEVCGLSVIMCTRRRTSRHSASSCSSEGWR